MCRSFLYTNHKVLRVTYNGGVREWRSKGESYTNSLQCVCLTVEKARKQDSDDVDIKFEIYVQCQCHQSLTHQCQSTSVSFQL